MEWIQQWWPQLIILGVFIIYVIRQEGKVRLLKSELDSHKTGCVDRHVMEDKYDAEFKADIKRSINDLFELVRKIDSTVNNISGWKNGISSK